MAKMKTVFLGHFFEALRAVYENSELGMVVCEKGKFPDQIRSFCIEKKIPLHIIESPAGLEDLISGQDLSDSTCVTASFGLIFTQKTIDCFLRVVNFHPGDVLTCRGRHPLPFAILKKLPMMAITAHFITSEEIDAGPVIAQISLPISYKNSYAFNASVLDLVLYNFVSNVLTIIELDGFEVWDWYGVSQAAYNGKLPSQKLNEVTTCTCLERL